MAYKHTQEEREIIEDFQQSRILSAIFAPGIGAYDSIPDDGEVAPENYVLAIYTNGNLELENFNHPLKCTRHVKEISKSPDTFKDIYDKLPGGYLFGEYQFKMKHL